MIGLSRNRTIALSDGPIFRNCAIAGSLAEKQRADRLAWSGAHWAVPNVDVNFSVKNVEIHAQFVGKYAPLMEFGGGGAEKSKVFRGFLSLRHQASDKGHALCV